MTAGILMVIPMRMPTGITDCMIRLVSTQQAPLAVILTRMPVRMPAVILVSGAALKIVTVVYCLQLCMLIFAFC